MDSEHLIQQFGKNAVVSSTSGCLFRNDDVKNSPDVLWEIAVHGKHEAFSWQETYRRLAEDLLRAIPAMQAAGIK